MLSRSCATRTGHPELPNPARLCFILSCEVPSGPNAGIVLISISSFPLLQISTRHGPSHNNMFGFEMDVSTCSWLCSTQRNNLGVLIRLCRRDVHVHVRSKL